MRDNSEEAYELARVPVESAVGRSQIVHIFEIEPKSGESSSNVGPWVIQALKWPEGPETLVNLLIETISCIYPVLVRGKADHVFQVHHWVFEEGQYHYKDNF